MFYFHLLSTVQITVRPNKQKICVFTVTFQKNLGSIGINFFFFFNYRQNRKCLYPISVFHFFEISGKQSFVEAVFYDKLRSFSTFFALNFDKKLAVE